MLKERFAYLLFLLEKWKELTNYSMNLDIKNPSNMNLSSLGPHVQGMYDYFDQKIGFQKPPVMVFDSEPSNQSKLP